MRMMSIMDDDEGDNEDDEHDASLGGRWANPAKKPIPQCLACLLASR